MEKNVGMEGEISLLPTYIKFYLLALTYRFAFLFFFFFLQNQVIQIVNT